MLKPANMESSHPSSIHVLYDSENSLGFQVQWGDAFISWMSCHSEQRVHLLPPPGAPVSSVITWGNVVFDEAIVMYVRP